MKLILFILFFLTGTLVSGCDPNNCGPTLINDKYYHLCCIDDNDQLEVVTDKYNITYNLGAPTIPGCKADLNDWAVVIKNDTNITCTDISEEDEVVYSFMNASSPDEGINVTYVTKNMKFTVLLSCNKNADEKQKVHFNASHSFQDQTYIIAVGVSQYGCSVANSNKVLDFLLKYNYIFAPFIIGIGILFCFFGLRHFNTVIYVTLLGATITSAGLVLEEITSFSLSQLTILVVLVSLIIADLFCTYVLKTLPTMGYIIVGTAFGAVNGLIIYDSMLSTILRDHEGDTIFYIIVSLCSLAAAALGAWVQKDGFIIFTAFIGSFMIIRPISAIFNNYPSEIAVANGLQNFNTATYAYLILVLIIASLGAKYQTKYYRDLRKQQKKNDEMIPFVEYMQFF